MAFGPYDGMHLPHRTPLRWVPRRKPDGPRPAARMSVHRVDDEGV